MMEHRVIVSHIIFECVHCYVGAASHTLLSKVRIPTLIDEKKLQMHLLISYLY